VAPSNQLNTKRYHQLDRIIGPMNGMSEREYAAHSGLSRGGVQKARKNGRLVVHDDGSINAAASDVRRAEMTDPDQQRRSLGGDGLASGPGDTTSYIKARTALTVYAAQERQLAVQKKKGRIRSEAHPPSHHSRDAGTGEKCVSLSLIPAQFSQSAGTSRFSLMFGQTAAYSRLRASQDSMPGAVSGLMASTGHSGSQTPQSMHSSGWMTSMFSPS
jgi:hypothetical protein